ncbi:agamous-like MADS-box protein AGL62-like, partial [Trifolium medium]|nr:agamous-like MADS-box protein AGL62-like [Trifolium medium]
DLSHLCRMTEDPSWWASPVDGMSIAQLELLKIALEEVNKDVGQQDDSLVILDAPIQTEQAQMLSTQFFQNPMLHTHLLGFNNMGGWEYGPSGSF